MMCCCISCNITDWLMLLSNLQNPIFDSCICLASDKGAQIRHLFFLILVLQVFNTQYQRLQRYNRN